ncbi:MAG: hypothetical protein RLZZ196_3313 [Bacteroidota bacterium]|jgi:hypothetical protein
MKLHNKDVIIDLLTNKEHLRDNDQALIANIWWRELVTQGKDKSTAFEMLKVFSEGKLSNPESIRRARQKIQEEQPELRGQSYRARHREQDNVKEQLGYN